MIKKCLSHGQFVVFREWQTCPYCDNKPNLFERIKGIANDTNRFFQSIKEGSFRKQG